MSSAQGEAGSADMIVVGSGAAGLTAALSGRVLGLSVTVIEKTSVFGGATALSEGMIWVPRSRQAQAAGIADSPEAALSYLQAASPHVDPARAAPFLRHAPEMLALVEANSPVRYELVMGSIDYYDSLQGAVRGGRALRPLPFDGRRLGADFARLRPPLASTMILGGMTVASRDLPDYFALTKSPGAALRVSAHAARYFAERLMGASRGLRLAGGNALVAGLLVAVRAAGSSLLPETRAVGLIMKEGRVVGLEVEGPAGQRRALLAEKGVLLASGGFSWNEAERREHYPHGALRDAHHSLTPADAATGDGLALAEAVGAGRLATLSHPAAWSPVSRVPLPGGKFSPFPHYMDRAKPGVIAVDETGRRFANEASPYQDFTATMAAALAERPGAEFHLLCDSRAIRRYGLGAAPPAPGRLRPLIRRGYILAAPSLDALSAQLGVPASALRDTATAMNAAAESGTDREFGKGGTLYERSNGDPRHDGPNPCLGRVIHPPFYAVRIHPGDIATFAGLATDGSAHVLDREGRPIPGLYAAGSDMATVGGGAYPAAGMTIGPAMTFGYIAAQDMAGR